MSDASNKPIEAEPPKTKKALRLGDYYWIGLVGGKLQEADRKSGIYRPRVYDGFRMENGYPNWVKRSTHTDEGGLALTFVNDTLIPELQAAWDKEAERQGVTREQQRSAPAENAAPPEGSLAEEILQSLTRWKDGNFCSPATLRGYRYAMDSFLRHSGQKAITPGYVFVKNDCPDIISKMLADSKKRGGAKKVMANTRYVLKHTSRFPVELVGEFKPPKANARRAPAAKQDCPFTPAERATIWKKLPEADMQVQGLILVAANSSQHGIDVANMTVKQLREALEDICVNERIKTHVQFRMVAWEETRSWFDAMKYDKNDIYAFDVVYSEKQLENPDINRIPLKETAQEAAERRGDASARAAKLVKKFLVEVCEIVRRGTSMHSFRYSNVSEWEAEGFARVACMACSGHLKEENYLLYAAAIHEQIMSISKTTHDFWKHADKERLHIFTKNQLYEAMVIAIKAESEKIIAALTEQHAAQDTVVRDEHAAQIAEIRKDHAAQTRAMREDHDAQTAEMRREHAAQNAKLDRIMNALAASLGDGIGMGTGFENSALKPKTCIADEAHTNHAVGI